MESDHRYSEPEYHNVILDLHLYDWQEPFTSLPVEGHIQDAIEWKILIQDQLVSHPVIIGKFNVFMLPHC